MRAQHSQTWGSPAVTAQFRGISFAVSSRNVGVKCSVVEVGRRPDSARHALRMRLDCVTTHVVDGMTVPAFSAITSAAVQHNPTVLVQL